jgi:hypothetical protein
VWKDTRASAPLNLTLRVAQSRKGAAGIAGIKPGPQQIPAGTNRVSRCGEHRRTMENRAFVRGAAEGVSAMVCLPRDALERIVDGVCYCDQNGGRCLGKLESRNITIDGYIHIIANHEGLRSHGNSRAGC